MGFPVMTLPGTKHSGMVPCRRCQDERYVLRSQVPEDGYICFRCRAVLAGRNALDPLPPPPTPARERAARAGGERLSRANALRKRPRSTPKTTHDSSSSFEAP
jgi:hypothetical protein